MALSLIVGGSAFASTGCDAVNAGGLDYLVTPPAGNVSNIAGVVFDAGDQLTLRVQAGNSLTILAPNNLTLTLGAVTVTILGGPGGSPTVLDGRTLTITANGTETTASSAIGNNAADAPTQITVTCMTQAAIIQQNKNLLKMVQGGSQLAAQTSGNAVSGAVSAAVSEAFADTCSALTPLDNGMRVNVNGLTDRDPACFDDNNKTRPTSGFASERDGGADAYAARRRSRAEDAFAAFEKKAAFSSRPQDWRVWVDVRGTNWNSSGAATDIRGEQVNVLTGITRRFTRNVVAGVYGGYESFKFTSDAITGRLKGDGGTIGSYVGWRIFDGVRFDAAFGYSQIGYSVSAAIMPGMIANANLTGDRWLVTAGLTGDYVWRAFTFEPSARVYWLTEKEGAYTDNFGNVQASRSFTTGRASVGNKVIAPASTYGTFAIAPYAGFYGDYYFTSDDSNVVLAQNGLPSYALQGMSGRAIAGLTGKTSGGAQLLVGGEYSGIGGNFRIWTYRARVGVPF
jgi:hypothetical protein